MYLTGEKQLKLDAKLRLTLPADFRRQFALREPRRFARVPDAETEFWIEMNHGFINLIINLFTVS